MIRLSQTLVGHLRGGLAQVVTLFSMFFAGISGSSTADVAVLSRTVAPEMDREGYDRAFTAALIASRLDDGQPDPAQHHGGGLRRDRQRLDRRPVPRRRRAGRADRHRPDDLQLLLRARSACKKQRATLGRSVVRGARLGAAADDPGDHHGRHPDRLVHADRGRDDRGGLHPGRADPGAQPRPHPAACRATSCTPGCSIRMPLAAVAGASAFGWMVAYLRGPDIVAGYITGFAGTDAAHDHVPAGGAVRDRRRLHRRGAGDHHLHADHQQADRGRQHQPAAHGRGDHHDAGVRPDHAALRTVAAGGVEIRRRRLRHGDGTLAAALRRVLR